MELYIGILMTLCCGFLVTNLIATSFALTEKIGLSFPIGMFLETIAILFLDMINIPFSVTSLLTIQIIILLCVGIPSIIVRKTNILTSLIYSTKNALTKTNFVWLVFIVAIIIIEHMNFTKCMWVPPYDNDSLSSFETIGYVAAQEHTFKGASIFNPDYIPNVNGPASTITYAPFVQLSYIYVYTLGAETSKIIPALMYLSFLFAFYGIIKRNMSKTAASLATFFMLITPEMMMFSTLSATNIMHAIFASLGILYLDTYIRKHDKKDMLISGILLGANMWCRNDGVVFIIAAIIIFLINAIRKKQYKYILPYFSMMLFPTLFWFIFTKAENMYSESVAITHLFWDPQKMKEILLGMWNLYIDIPHYGCTFIVFSIMLVANIWFIIRKRDSVVILALILISLSFYIFGLYHIDYKWDSMTNVLLYSAKRFWFCFVPLIWYYSCSNYVANFLFSKLDYFLSLHPKLQQNGTNNL